LRHRFGHLTKSIRAGQIALDRQLEQVESLRISPKVAAERGTDVKLHVTPLCLDGARCKAGVLGKPRRAVREVKPLRGMRADESLQFPRERAGGGPELGRSRPARQANLGSGRKLVVEMADPP